MPLGYVARPLSTDAGVRRYQWRWVIVDETSQDRHASLSGCTAAIPAGTAAIYGGTRAVYPSIFGCNATIFGGSAAMTLWQQS